MDAIDDTTPTANEESWDDVTGADSIPGGTGGANMMHYSNGSLMDGLTLSASYTPSNGATEVESSMDYGFAYTGVDGLTIGAATGEDNTSATAGLDLTQMYAKYTMDAISVGVHMSESDSETAVSESDSDICTPTEMASIVYFAYICVRSRPAVAEVLSSPVAAPIVKPSTPVYAKPQSIELSTSVAPFDGV